MFFYGSSPNGRHLKKKNLRILLCYCRDISFISTDFLLLINRNVKLRCDIREAPIEGRLLFIMASITQTAAP